MTEDQFVAELFAPELGTDGKPWTPGDDPKRRVPEVSDAEQIEIDGIKARAALALDKSSPDSGVYGKCMITLEGITAPLVAKMEIPPVADSIREGAKRTGTCPECGGHVGLSQKGFLGAHTVRRGAVPKSPALVESNIIPTDTDLRVGDPNAGSKRRAEQIDGAFERGTVAVKSTDPDTGKRVTTDVPATEDNIREALRQELDRKRPTASKVASLRRQLDAAVAGPIAQTAVASPEGLVSPVTGKETSQALPGPALAPRDKGTEAWDTEAAFKADMVNAAHAAALRKDSKGRPLPRSGTMDRPVGRATFDATVTGPVYATPAGPVSGPIMKEYPGTRGYGYKTEAQYDAMTPSAQRRYRREIVARSKRPRAVHHRSQADPRGVAPGVVGRAVYSEGSVVDITAV